MAHLAAVSPKSTTRAPLSFARASPSSWKECAWRKGRPSPSCVRAGGVRFTRGPRRPYQRCSLVASTHLDPAELLLDELEVALDQPVAHVREAEGVRDRALAVASVVVVLPDRLDVLDAVVDEQGLVLGGGR